MRRTIGILAVLLCMALLLGGCGLRTVDQLYCLPRRSDAEMDLQQVIDQAMDDLSYSAPIYGENRQVTQTVDLDGDGVAECLLFAEGEGEKPLKILIFCQLASGYVLMDTIEGYGFAFDFVEYAQIDGEPGLEIVVGRQVSDQITRSVSVYRFSSGQSRQLLSASCNKMVTCDLDADGCSELVLLGAGELENDLGVLSVYQMEGQLLETTSQTELHYGLEQVKGIAVGSLSDGVAGIIMTSAAEGDASVFDIYTMTDHTLTCVYTAALTQPAQGRISAQDMDGDGITELPDLLEMPEHPQNLRMRYYVRWYSVSSQGICTDKLYAYIHHDQGWYLDIRQSWMQDMAVVSDLNRSDFYMPGADGDWQKVLTIYMLDDADRELIAQSMGYTVLYKTDTVIYAADIPGAAELYGITGAVIQAGFHGLRTELNTQEN